MRIIFEVYANVFWKRNYRKCALPYRYMPLMNCVFKKMNRKEQKINIKHGFFKKN